MVARRSKMRADKMVKVGSRFLSDKISSKNF